MYVVIMSTMYVVIIVLMVDQNTVTLFIHAIYHFRPVTTFIDSYFQLPWLSR